MIYTLTMNPALDYFVLSDSLELGKINTYRQARYRPGGKGINVSQLLTHLGVETIALGVVAGFSGDVICHELSKQNCKHRFISLPTGLSRINVKVRTLDGEETDLNGDGPEMPENIFNQLLTAFSLLERGDFVVLSGKLPGSLFTDFYAQLMNALAKDGVKFVVDATGPALRACLAAKPFLIKPNLSELEALFDTHISTKDDLLIYSRKLLNSGAQIVLVSLGENGAFCCSEEGSFHLPAGKGNVISTIGAGDAMVAGFLYGYLLHSDTKLAAQWGVAAGSATACSYDIASKTQVLEMYRRTFN